MDESADLAARRTSARVGPLPAESQVEHVAWPGARPALCRSASTIQFAWRGWWDFGTGALGDMACHTVNMPYMALNLRDPIAVQAECSGHNGDSYPQWSMINFDFPALGNRPAVKLFWYDGSKRPDEKLIDGKEMSASGSLVIGEKGKLYAPGDYAENPLILLGGIQSPEVKWVESPGHFEEWIRAIKGGEPAVSNFPEYAGGLDGDDPAWEISRCGSPPPARAKRSNGTRKT